MHLHSTGDVDEYAAAVRTFLEAEPCERNVLLSVVDSVRDAPAAYASPASFWWITDSGGVVGAASWTPPFPLLVSSMPDAAAPGLAAAMLERAASLGVRPPGVNGPVGAARAVAAAWTGAGGDTVERERIMLLHELRELVDVPSPPGSRRSATAADVALIAEWLLAFATEVAIVAGPASIAERMVAAGHADLWIDGGMTVCLVGHRVAAGVLRVGPVYTPPEHRNRGYGRRLTYEVTAAEMARPDVHQSMLFTDADNPVSNSIYRQAGYELRGEHVEIEFA